MQDPIVRHVHDVLAFVDVKDSDVAVGLSGGVDSVVLLHVLLQLRAALNLRVSALHVHHGLSPNADAWAQHCASLCHAWDVPLTVRRVSVNKSDARGVEAAARSTRYACYHEVRARFVALAHHQDDQAETVLLQMLRGAGVAGIAAMPILRDLDDERQLLRPLLSVSRAQLLDYARGNALRWIEDESNDDASYPRNFLRREVLPTLSARFPGYRAALSRVAENAADAAALINEVGRQDLSAVSMADGIDVERLRGLGQARAANVLRIWLSSHGHRAPSRDHLLELLQQALHASADAQPQVAIEGVSIRRYRDRLMLRAEPMDDSSQWEVQWRGEAEVALPDGRRLCIEPTRGEGIARALMLQRQVRVTFRRGGERLSVARDRPRRTLKNLLQECAIPPWERERLPLLFVDDQLVWAHRVGMDPDFCVAGDAEGFRLEVREPAQGR